MKCCLSQKTCSNIYMKKGCFLTSKSFRLTIFTPHPCPRLTSSASNASISTMVFTVFPFPLTQSRMIRAFSATSQITVEMEPEKKKKLIKIWHELNHFASLAVPEIFGHCDSIAGGVVSLKVPLSCTFVDYVANGLGAKCVIQWNHHQGVCVTGHL